MKMFICDACGKEIQVAAVRSAWVAAIEKETQQDLCQECYGEWAEIKNQGLKIFIKTRKEMQKNNATGG